MLTEGALVGQIRLVRRLGAGGMGEVWEGVDESLGRHVAVKTVHRPPGRPDPHARARFAREARLLSQLEHPHICRLYEYVRAEPDDVLILELVRGRPLRDAIASGLAPTERLETALGICSALVAAHSLSIVHRDLKPDNVMLDESGSVKVLDFGIARRSRPGEADDTEEETTARQPPEGASGLTRAGEMLGTPGYMSPEQARGEVATAASDMYCFGLLLFELYTGRPPFEPAPAHRVLERACWGEIPSTSGIDHAVAALIRDLTLIDPLRRPTAGQARERLRRIAGRPQRRFRAIAAAIAVASLVAGTGLSLAGLARARREAATARATTEFLAGLFRGSDPNEAPNPEIKAREVLARGTERLREELRDETATRARLLAVLGRIHGNLGLHGEARRLLEEAIAVEERRSGHASPTLLPALTALGATLAAQGDHAAAQPPLTRAIALARRHARAAEEAEALNHLTSSLAHQGQLDQAEARGLEAVAASERAYGSDHPQAAAVRVNLALVEIDRGRFAEAARMLSPALVVLERHLGPEHPDVTRATVNLATIDKELGRFAEAEALYRRALATLQARLGPDHPECAVARNDLAVVLFEQRRYGEAESEYRQAVELAERTLGRRHPLTAIFTSNLAEATLALGRAGEAEPLFRTALETLRAALGDGHAAVAEVLRGLGRTEAALGRSGEAEAHLLESLRVREAAAGADHPEVGRTLVQLGAFYLDQRRPAEAAPRLARARDVLAAALPEEHPARAELALQLDRLAAAGEAP
ncbi:MAG: serine/threonine protein kinase [Acidobacteria bacterium]|nr:serine/threonine protein kinase [Acidobacteriota bacterium]